MRVYLAQINATIADLDGNVRAIERAAEAARAADCDVLLTPELAVLGYPPLDLLERHDLLQACAAMRPRLAAASRGLALIAGNAVPTEPRSDGARRRPARNVAEIYVDGVYCGTVAKRLLPTYDVFDEDRYFEPGASAEVFTIAGRRVGVTICEDIWSDDESGVRRYDVDPVDELVAAGADCVLNLSASPFDLGKASRRLDLVREIARDHGVPVAYCNLVGGNDALIFDGRSFAIDGGGEVLGHAAAFAEDALVVSIPAARAAPVQQIATTVPAAFAPTAADEARAALVLGVRDYLRKCGFREAVIGLSGGIDSAVTAAIAVEALGADAVMGVALPGPHSSDHSIRDAIALAENLGIRCPIVSITGTYDALVETLRPELDRPGTDRTGVTLQNLQARARGVALMGISNHSGRLLLTTGNKSELAVGYCTLYGDMNGGLAVIGDLPKMLVYDVARSFNREREIVPQATIDKAPSAELAPDQKDEDNLPPYPLLDAMLEAYLVHSADVDGIVAATACERALAERIVRLVEINEYKRRQAAPVLRVTRKAFGGGRRIPMARLLPPRAIA
ncbi:MAG: glutamine-dependent synthetase [Pseudomonadota bacterium]|jgi:NAD+ synthetase